jgi:hypothetical protein
MEWRPLSVGDSIILFGDERIESAILRGRLATRIEPNVAADRAGELAG